AASRSGQTRLARCHGAGLEVRQERRAKKTHRGIQLLAQDAQNVGDAPLAVPGQAPYDWAADLHRTGSQRQRLDDVGATANAAVDKHLDPAADRLSYRGEYLDGRRGSVKLTVTMIRRHDRGGT